MSAIDANGGGGDRQKECIKGQTRALGIYLTIVTTEGRRLTATWKVYSDLRLNLILCRR
jgi:hypothetical protein